MRKSLSLILATFSILLSIASCKKVETITLNDPMIINGMLTMEFNTNHQILYSVEPEGTTVTWTSSSPSVAYVIGDWIASGIPGSAQITGTTPNGGTASFNVYVNPAKITAFTIPEELLLYVDETKDIEVTDIEPVEADANSIEWTVEGEGVFSFAVEQNTIHITGLSYGAAELKGTSTGGATRTCMIGVSNIDASLSATSLNLVSGDSSIETLKVNQNPKIYSGDAFTWTTSDPSVVKITPNGDSCQVQAGNSGGEATVSVSFGNHTLNCKVSVMSRDIQPYFLVGRDNYGGSSTSNDWAWNRMQPTVLRDGSTIYVVPGDDMAFFGGDGIGFRTYDHLCGICMEDGSKFPTPLLSSLQFSYDDAGDIFKDCVFIKDIGHLYSVVSYYKPGCKASVTVTTDAGRKCTIYFVTEIKKIALSSHPGGYAYRELVGIVDNGGTMTIKKSELKVNTLGIDLGGSEFDGYGMLKSSSLLLTSSNTNVASVTSTSIMHFGTSTPVACLSFSGKSTGTTVITIKLSSSTNSITTAASFTLNVVE